MPDSRQRPTNDMTELARERSRGAAERTLLSWVQNCLALIGMGIASEQLFVAAGNPQSAAANLKLVQWGSLGLVGLGVLLLLAAILVYRRQVRRLSSVQAADLEWHWLAVGAVVLLGAGALVILLR